MTELSLKNGGSWEDQPDEANLVRELARFRRPAEPASGLEFKLCLAL